MEDPADVRGVSGDALLNRRSSQRKYNAREQPVFIGIIILRS